MSVAMLGAATGLLGGAGLWLIAWRLMSARMRLPDRIAPYLRERPATSGLLLAPQRPPTPFATVEGLLAPVMSDVVRLFERLGSTSLSVRRRLQLLGEGRTLQQFRVEQVIWCVGGLAAGLLIGLVLVAGRGLAVIPAIVLAAVCALAGPLVHDRWLSAQVAARQRRLLAELPAVAELLALAVSAGEGPVAAMERVTRSACGELSGELARTLADTRSGTTPLATALERLATRTTQPAVARFADGIAVAVERGTPLADLLRAQAQDAREVTRRELMETGGKKEIAMMIPVVFLVLPVTVLFALFPGIALLQVGI